MSDDKIKNIRKTSESNLNVLKDFKNYLADNLPESQYVLNSLEFVEAHIKDLNNLWVYAYELQYRVLDLEKDKQNIEKRLTALENDE